jgi:hypothetical protein
MAPKQGGQRAILNFTPGGQGWTSSLGVSLAPRGEICPLGPWPPGLNIIPRGELGSQGWNLSPRGNVNPFVHPWPPDLNFIPRGKLGPQGWYLSPRGNVNPFVHPRGWTFSTV